METLVRDIEGRPISVRTFEAGAEGNKTGKRVVIMATSNSRIAMTVGTFFRLANKLLKTNEGILPPEGVELIITARDQGERPVAMSYK